MKIVVNASTVYNSVEEICKDICKQHPRHTCEGCPMLEIRGDHGECLYGELEHAKSSEPTAYVSFLRQIILDNIRAFYHKKNEVKDTPSKIYTMTVLK